MKIHNAAPATQHPGERQTANDALSAQLWEQIIQLRSSLQKWHTAISRNTGNTVTDVFHGQGRALQLLAAHGEMTQRDMCAHLGVRPQSLGETLGKLERGGYITRRPHDADHRALCVAITDRGRDLLERSNTAPPFTSFTEEELERFSSYVQRALDDMDDQIAALDHADIAEEA